MMYPLNKFIQADLDGLYDNKCQLLAVSLINFESFIQHRYGVGVRMQERSAYTNVNAYTLNDMLLWMV